MRGTIRTRTDGMEAKVKTIQVYLLFLISYAYANTMPAQVSDQLFFGPVQDEYKGSPIVSVFGHSDDHFLVLREGKRRRDDYILEKIEIDSLRAVGSKFISFPSILEMEPQLAYPVSLAGHDYILATTQRSESDSVYIFAFQVMDDLNLAPRPLLIGAGKGSILLSQGGFQTFIDDSRKFLTAIVPMESQAGKNEKFQMHLFDSALRPLHVKDLEVPHPSDTWELVDAEVDSSVGVYLLSSSVGALADGLSDKRNIGKDFSLFHYDWESDVLNEKSLSLGTKWLYDVRILFNTSKNLQVVGYYSNMIDLIMAGTFSLELDRSSGKVLNQGLSPFDRNFRARFRPRANNLNDTELGKYDLDYVHALDNGMVQLISEKNYMHTSTVFNPGTGSYSIVNVYNFDQILVTSISSVSKIDHALMLPKFQASQQSLNSYTSFLSFVAGDFTFLVYNDNERNESLSLQEEKGYRQINSENNSEAMMVVIDAQGNAKKLPLFLSTSLKAVFNPTFMYQTKDAVIMLAASGYRTQYFKFNLDQTDP